jgi:hypothetical protein
MGRFLLGFFLAALIFETDRTIDVVGAIAEVGKSAVSGIDDVSKQIVDKAEREIAERGLAK